MHASSNKNSSYIALPALQIADGYDDKECKDLSIAAAVTSVLKSDINLPSELTNQAIFATVNGTHLLLMNSRWREDADPGPPSLAV